MPHLGEHLAIRWYIAVDNHRRKNKVLMLEASSRIDAIRAAAQMLKDEYALLRIEMPPRWEFTIVGSEPASADLRPPPRRGRRRY